MATQATEVQRLRIWEHLILNLKPLSQGSDRSHQLFSEPEAERLEEPELQDDLHIQLGRYA